MKPQRKKGEGRKSEQHSSHAQPKPSSVQSVVGGVHLQSDSTATNEHARTDHQSSTKSSSAGNQPSCRETDLFSVLAYFLSPSRLLFFREGSIYEG